MTLPIPRAGSTFTSVLIPAADIASSPAKKDKRKRKTSQRNKRATSNTSSDAHTGPAIIAADEDATRGTTAHQPEIGKDKAEKEERRKAKLVERLLRLEQLEKDSKKAKKMKKGIEKLLSRLEERRSKEIKRISKLCGKILK